MSDPLVIIPARMAATRLPNKPMAEIAGEAMIVHVWRRAIEAGIGPVIVATDAEEIAASIRAAGGVAVMTRADHPSGSDRVFEALETYDPDGVHDIIVNVQGDLPTIDPRIIAASLLPLANPGVDISTLAAIITREEEKSASQVVKVVGSPITPHHLRALYFTRATAPWGEGDLLHHIGLYAWRRSALRRFVSLPPSMLELREKLEQLRALEAGMRVDCVIVDTVPLGVDTPEDLARAREILSGQEGLNR
jgi:3-deoxy-manno-octulosonate cytidylyltransferase (CMP-KDO synthetase)